ncbi:MAG: hypothetical protein WBD31_00640 [Rubripirellula sp.]
MSMGVVPIDCGCHPGTTACQSRGIHDRSALALFAHARRCAVDAHGRHPAEDAAAIVAAKLERSNQFRLGVESISLRQTTTARRFIGKVPMMFRGQQRPAHRTLNSPAFRRSVENRKPSLTPAKRFRNANASPPPCGRGFAARRRLKEE